MLGAIQRFRYVKLRRTHPALISILLLLSACQNAAAPAPPEPPPTAAPITFMMIDELVDSATAQARVTVAGYLVLDTAGAALVDGLSFTAEGVPRPIEGDSNRIWLASGIETGLKERLRSAGGLQFAAARARGRLEGPGAYGPGGGYRYLIVLQDIQLLAAHETTIGDLLDHKAGYEGQLVRLAGGLIARDSSALLVEQLGAGGLPEPKARQIKLRAPLRDRALLEQLKGASGGALRFGQVRVEGFWRGGLLVPLSIVLLT